MLRPSRTTTIEPYSNDRRQWQADSSRSARRFNERQTARKMLEADRAFNQAIKNGMEARPEGLSDWSMGGATPTLGSQGVTTPMSRSPAQAPSQQKKQTGVMPLGRIDARVGVTPVGYSKSPKTAQMERYIRDAAVKRGIDPNTAVKVAKSEGLGANSWQSNQHKKGRREKSYGPFQLNIEKGRLGAQFMKATGLDPRDESTVEAQIDFALDHAAKHGWGSWFGAARVGVAKRQGLTKAQPMPAAPELALAETDTPPPSAVDAVNQMATGGLMAKPDPADRRTMPGAAIASKQGLGAFLGAQAKNGLGSFYGEPTVAETPEQIDAATVQQATQQAVQKAQEVPSYTVNNTPATPEQRMGDMIDMPGMTDFERSVNAQSAAKFNPDAVKAAGLSRLGPPDVASMPGGIRANAANPDSRMMTDDKGTFADPFGTMQPGGIMAKASTPKFQNSLTNPETATGPTVMSPVQQSAPTEARVTPSMQEDRFTREQAPQVASLDPNAAYEAAHPVNTAFDDQYEAAVAAPDLSAPTDVPDYTVADAEQAPDEPTIGEYPSAPEPSFAESNPRLTSTVKDAMKGFGIAGVPGALAGAGLGLLGGRLGPGFDAAVPDADRFSVGSGLPGIRGALGGPRGATANSLSNPGMSVTSLGTGQSLRRSNNFGWTEVVDPSGSVVGIQFDHPEQKGLLGSVSKRAGGLLGGRGGGLSRASRDAIGAGKGGLY